VHIYFTVKDSLLYSVMLIVEFIISLSLTINCILILIKSVKYYRIYKFMV